MLTESLKRILAFEREFAAVIVHGISAVVRTIAAEANALFQALTFYQLGFYAASVGIMIAGAASWIRYIIDFGAPEAVDVGSSAKLLFLLPGITGLLFATFPLPYRTQIYRATAALSGLLYVAGLIFPNPVHTSIQEGAFHFRFWLYLYGPLLVTQAALSVQGLTDAAIHPERIRERLFPPAPAEEGKPSSRRKTTRSGRA